jgi:hypothetical protein
MMSEEINMPNPPEPVEEPKKNRTVLWIILAVVAVILICLCLAVVVAVVIFAVADGGWDMMDNYYHIPTLLNMI